MTNSGTNPKAVLRTTKSRSCPVSDDLRFVLAFWVVVGHFETIQLFAAKHWVSCPARVQSRLELRSLRNACGYR